MGHRRGLTLSGLALSYKRAACMPMGCSQSRRYAGPLTTTEVNAMNTIIYIVGLVVVIGAVLAFFGLR